MKSHLSTLTARLIRAALRSTCNFRVVAVGFNHRNEIIGIATNAHRFETHDLKRRRGWHAEERLMHRSPQSLSRIEIARVGHGGNWLPIDPCAHCRRLAMKRGIQIKRYGE